jgi:ferredoxin-thioredoxin reductase catalytic subunit
MISANLFDLSPEQETLSRSIYDGKIIKCLVAPYHTYRQLEKMIEFDQHIYLLPEKEVTIQHLKQLVATIVATGKNDVEYKIVTANQNVIMDMIDPCVRVLTEREEIVESPIKTFYANIHDIRYSLLENKDHQLTDEEKDNQKSQITQLINDLEEAKNGVSETTLQNLIHRVELVGDIIVKISLRNMLKEVKIDK